MQNYIFLVKSTVHTDAQNRTFHLVQPWVCELNAIHSRYTCVGFDMVDLDIHFQTSSGLSVNTAHLVHFVELLVMVMVS